MKSFLLRGGTPIIKWGMLPDNVYFEGNVPEGYSLAVSPSDGYIVVDVDRHGGISGFDNIPYELYDELDGTLSYSTKNNGKHFWFKYTGNRTLPNKTSGKGIDLRTHKGYVVFYPKEDFRTRIKDIKESSQKMNKWIEKLFTYVKK